MDLVRATAPGVVLMGGSTDVDAAFQWMCGLGGNGDFLIIRATGTDAYNPYIRHLSPSANSMVWIAGGDQLDYINFWKDTPVQSTLNARIAAGRFGLLSFAVVVSKKRQD